MSIKGKRVGFLGSGNMGEALIRGMLQGGPVRPVQGVDATVELVAPAVTDDVSAVRTPDLHALEWVAWSPLLALTLVLGVAPGLLLTPVGDAVAAFFGGL